MFKKLLTIAAISTTANAASVGWRKGNCPKAGSIKTKFTDDERATISSQQIGSWMVIADDK
jgi:hypothetical protein